VANAQKQVVSLGTGGVTGVYYPTGGSLCRIVNAFRSTHGLRCVLEATQGSVSNITRVLNHTLDLGIAQSNWIFLYYNQPLLNVDNSVGQVFNTGANPQEIKPLEAKELRTLLVLYPEYFTVIVPKNSDIYQFDDIKGKRISMGVAGSSLRATMTELLIKKGWHKSDFKQILNLEASEQASALCEGRIDVMIYTVGHPSGAAREATQDCDSRLIAVSGSAIQALLAENSYFRWAKIPGALYKGNIKSVETFAVNATLFTSTALSNQAAYSLVKATFEQFNEFRSLHPAFTRLDPEQMVKGPFAAPLHEGAVRYFKEIGLM
jgi:TRAP transporter TAXI family solute receptor